MSRARKMTSVLVAGCAALPLVIRAELPAPLIRFRMNALTDGKVLNEGMAQNADLQVGARCKLVEGVDGTGLWFDGVPDIGTMSSFSCPSLTSRTVSFWMHRENAISTFQAATEKNCLPWLIGNLSRLNIRLAENSQTRLDNDTIVPFMGSGEGTYMNNGSAFAVRGAWVNVTLVIDVKSAEGSVYTFDWKLYANGILDAHGENQVANDIAAQTTCVVGNQSSTRPFFGAIDEFRVYDSALSAVQVKAVFEEFAGNVSTVKLVGHWPCDEFTQNGGAWTTPDRSGYGKDLALGLGCVSSNGPFGTCLSCSGTAASTVKLAKKINSSSWAFWFRHAPNDDPARKNSVLAKVGKFFMSLDSTYTSRRFVYQIPRSEPISEAMPGTPIIHQGTWQHAVFVNRGEQDPESGNYTVVPELWINGECVVTGETVTSDAFELPPADDLSLFSSFKGLVDDIRVYSGALSSNEIARIYRGVAKPMVPADFSVKGARTVLCGEVASSSGDAYRVGYNGTVAWSCVAKPEGSSEPVFLRDGNPVTEVTLPSEGAYTFRLSVTDELGGEKHDDVIVTRDDAGGGVSPGVPDVTVAMSDAEKDAAAAASLSSGLIRHWDGAGNEPEKDKVNKSKSLALAWTDEALNRLIPGDGIAPYAFQSGDQTQGFSAGEVIQSIDRSGGNGAWPKDEWRTFSLWMYQDSEMSKKPHYSPCIVSSRVAFYVNLNKWDNPKTDGLQQTSGIYILQCGGTRTAAGSTQSKLWCPAPFSFTNRWTHLVVALNQHDSSKMQLWLDGVKRDLTVVSLPKSGDEYYGGRVMGDYNWIIGGIDYKSADYSSDSNAIYSVAFDRPGGTAYSRTFPGKLADIRLYDRTLTPDEVGYLYRHPGLRTNVAPVVGPAGASNPKPTSKMPISVSSEAADDGIAVSSTYEWLVAEGDAAKVVFDTPRAKETSVTFLKAGTYKVLMKVDDGERVTYGEPIEVTVERPGLMLLFR